MSPCRVPFSEISVSRIWSPRSVSATRCVTAGVLLVAAGGVEEAAETAASEEAVCEEAGA